MSRRPRRRSSWLCESVSPHSSHWLPSHRLLFSGSRDRSSPITHVIGRLFPVPPLARGAFFVSSSRRGAIYSSFLVAALSSVHHRFVFFLSSRYPTLVANQDLCVPPVETFARRDWMWYWAGLPCQRAQNAVYYSRSLWIIWVARCQSFIDTRVHNEPTSRTKLTRVN